MRCEMAYPWMGPSATIFRISMSSAPCSKSVFSDGIFVCCPGVLRVFYARICRMSRYREKRTTRGERHRKPSPDAFRTHGLKWVGHEVHNRAHEPPGVGQLGMRVEGRLVDPFGVNEVDQGTARRFVYMDAHAPGLRARRLQDARQLAAQLRLFSRQGFKAGKDV